MRGAPSCSDDPAHLLAVSSAAALVEATSAAATAGTSDPLVSHPLTDMEEEGELVNGLHDLARKELEEGVEAVCARTGDVVSFPLDDWEEEGLEGAEERVWEAAVRQADAADSVRSSSRGRPPSRGSSRSPPPSRSGSPAPSRSSSRGPSRSSTARPRPAPRRQRTKMAGPAKHVLKAQAAEAVAFARAQRLQERWQWLAVFNMAGRKKGKGRSL